MNENLSEISAYVDILQLLEDSPDSMANDTLRLEICGKIGASLLLLNKDYNDKLETWDKKGLLKDKF